MAKYVEDVEEALPKPAAQQAAAPAAPEAAAVPAPAPTSPAPAQQPGPTPAAPAPTRSTVSAEVDEDFPGTKTAKAAHQANTDNYNMEFDGDDKMMSTTDGLELIRPDKGKTARFALLTNYVPPKAVCNHYIKGKGTFHCLDAENKAEICCTTAGQKESQPQAVALALQYTNADPRTGRYSKGPDGHYPPIQWTLGFVRLSRSGWKRVKNLPEEESRPEDIDITISHRDNGIGYDYTKASVARWKRNPDLVKEVEAAIKPFLDGKKLLAKLGKRISKLEYKAVLASLSPATSSGEPDLSQIDDI